MKQPKPSRTTRTARPRCLQRVVRAWIAVDTTKICLTKRDKHATVMFARKPKLMPSGFWYAYRRGDGGRWPIPNWLRIKPGQCVEVVIRPNVKVSDAPDSTAPNRK